MTPKPVPAGVVAEVASAGPPCRKCFHLDSPDMLRLVAKPGLCTITHPFRHRRITRLRRVWRRAVIPVASSLHRRAYAPPDSSPAPAGSELPRRVGVQSPMPGCSGRSPCRGLRCPHKPFLGGWAEKDHGSKWDVRSHSPTHGRRHIRPLARASPALIAICPKIRPNMGAGRALLLQRQRGLEPLRGLVDLDFGDPLDPLESPLARGGQAQREPVSM